MATCSDCGVEVAFEETTDGRLALDKISQPTGPERYRMRDGEERIFEKVTRAGQFGQPAHRTTCAAKQRSPR